MTGMSGAKTNKAILAVSFGTTHEQTRKATIDAIEEHLRQTFPDRALYRGWTSRMILNILEKRTGCSFDSVEEALERMAVDGIVDLLVQPTHIIGGEENEKMRETIQKQAGRFERIRIGRPLLDTPDDLTRLAQILAARLLPEERAQRNRTGLVLMGHGSAGKLEANQVYRDLQSSFRNLGEENVFVGTVEGTPDLDGVLEELGGSSQISGIVLTPLMIVAGDHAVNDMAGEDEDSWKNRLQKEGYTVTPVVRGLGEYPEVREMFAEHARCALRGEE